MEENAAQSLPPPTSHDFEVAPTLPGQPATAEANQSDVFCPDCGYNLHSLTGDRCPECGGDIRTLLDDPSEIPWLYRKQKGWIRSYWKTMRLVTFGTKEFSREADRRVNLRQARKFRRVTILQAYVPLIAMPLGVLASRNRSPTLEVYLYCVVSLVASFAYLWAITILPYYALFHRDLPPERQQRAAGLMLYAAAPMAWMYVPALVAVGAITLAPHDEASGGRAPILIGAFLSAGLALLIPWGVINAMRRMLNSPRESFRIGVRFVASWVAAILLTLVGIPLAVLLPALVFFSFR